MAIINKNDKILYWNVDIQDESYEYCISCFRNYIIPEGSDCYPATEMPEDKRVFCNRCGREIKPQ